MTGEDVERGGDCWSRLSASGDGGGVQVELRPASAFATGGDDCCYKEGQRGGGGYKGGVAVCYKQRRWLQGPSAGATSDVGGSCKRQRWLLQTGAAVLQGGRRCYVPPVAMLHAAPRPCQRVRRCCMRGAVVLLVRVAVVQAQLDIVGAAAS
jgi:hypothetical protein